MSILDIRKKKESYDQQSEQRQQQYGSDKVMRTTAEMVSRLGHENATKIYKRFMSTTPIITDIQIHITIPEFIQASVMEDFLLSSADAGYLLLTISEALDRYQRHTVISSADKIVSLRVDNKVDSIREDLKTDDMYEEIWFDDKNSNEDDTALAGLQPDVVFVIVVIVFISGVVVGILVSIMCTKAPRTTSLLPSSTSVPSSTSSSPSSRRKPSFFRRGKYEKVRLDSSAHNPMNTEDGTIDFIDDDDDDDERESRNHQHGRKGRQGMVEIELGSIPVPSMREEIESSTGETVQSIEFQHGFADLPVSISSSVTNPSDV